MKPTMAVGIVLIVLGLVALAYRGITYTTQEKVIAVGPVRVTAEKEKVIRIPPIVGPLAVGSGLVRVLISASRRS